jgi:tryptophan-rich sensory protein
MNRDKLKNIGIFIGCLILCQAAGGLGTIATIPNIPTWYAALHKPFFNPPNWIFGPVWTILYTLMAVSLYLIFRASHPDRSKAMALFFLQLALNAIWSFLFFQYHLLLISLIEIILMLGTIIAFTILSHSINKTASYCFIPYIAWVSFATLLNAGIWYLN